MATRKAAEAKTQVICFRDIIILNTLDARIATQSLKSMKRDAIMEVNGRLVIRKQIRDRRVGCDEWDVDGKRMTLPEALTELLPGEEQSILRGKDL